MTTNGSHKKKSAIFYLFVYKYTNLIFFLISYFSLHRCLIYRYKLKQALYTKFLYTQVQEKSNPDPTYELIFEKDLDSICHFKKDIYAEPFTNSVRTNRTRDLTEDEAGYLTPNNYFNGSALFWQKVLANAKPSEVRKVFDQKRISHGTRKSVVYAVPKQEVTWHVHVADIHTASSSNV